MRLENIKERLVRVPFLFVLLGIAIFFWVNGPAFFEDWSTTYGQMIAVYISMMLVFLFFAKRKLVEESTETLGKAVQKYVTGFFATFVLMAVLSLAGAIQFGQISDSLIWPTVILQICVVATAEELMFRGVLLSYVGIVASSALFAIWHSYAYGLLWYNLPPGADFTSLILIFVFGCVLGWLTVYQKNRIGLIGAVAAHSCYNLCLLGVLGI